MYNLVRLCYYGLGYIGDKKQIELPDGKFEITICRKEYKKSYSI